MFKDWGGCVVNGVATLRCIPIVFENTVTALLYFVGAVAIFLMVYAGIRFMTSGGDPKNVAHARQVMTYAIIGLIIVLCSFGIIILISYMTGTDCIKSFTFGACK